MSMVTGSWKSQSSLDVNLAVLGVQNPHEDANLTPIFDSLASGARRGQPGPVMRPVAAPPAVHDRGLDPVVEFELDPLHAPIPPQKLAGPSQLRSLRSVSGGRHRR